MTPSTHPSRSVSVVLCTYNGAAYLREQLRSIADQTLRPAELIASDDASTDATVEILESFRRDAPFPVHILRNARNIGSTANFDQAMARASGTYLALADQDDVWLPQKLATLVDVLVADPTLGAAFSDAFLLDSRAAEASSTLPRAGKQTLWSMHGFTRSKQALFTTRASALRLLLRADVITGATMLLRADLRPLWQPIPSSWVHDGWLSWMLATHSRIQPVSEPLMYYRLHRQQQLGVGTDSTLASRVEAVRLTERARYTRVSAQFGDLLERLRRLHVDPQLEGQIGSKMRLLQRRAALPRSTFLRSLAILAAAPAYMLYARGLRSMRKDFFLD